MPTPDLISRAQAGDGDAFRAVTEPHVRELQVHCYRMLGSFQDAESAYESADLDAIVDLLTDDVFMAMPPMPHEYEGRDVVARFCAGIFGAGRRFDLVRTRADGQPAFGAYLRAARGIRPGAGLIALALTDDRICAMSRFESGVLESFGLPRSLPSP